MEYDYYAFRQAELSEVLGKLEQAIVALNKAKEIKDERARQKAEDQIAQAAERTVVEPHLAYLWFKASVAGHK